MVQSSTSTGRRASTDGLLDSVQQRVVASGVPKVARESRIGDPAEQILAMVTERQADLVVCGSRCHGRIAGLLIGSVAQKLVAAAACPVLVVPNPAS